MAFAVSAYASLAYPKPVGADIWFHLDIVNVYLQGGNGGFAPFVMQINGIPYPPLFHLVLLPSVAAGAGLAFARFLQMLIYPYCLLFALLLVERFGFGKIHILTTGLALIGSFAYLDATFQIRPESLDILLWLVFAYALLVGKAKTGIASVVAGIWNHSFPVLAFTGGGLLWKHQFKSIWYILAFSFPILATSAYYLLGFAGKWFLTPASPQAQSFLLNPFGFVLNYMGALLVALPVAVYMLLKWKSLTDLSKLSLVTVASSLALLPIWYDRYFQYVSVPLAIVLGEFVAANTRLKFPIRGGTIIALYVLLFVAAFFVANYMNLWNSNLNGLWDIH